MFWSANWHRLHFMCIPIGIKSRFWPFWSTNCYIIKILFLPTQVSYQVSLFLELLIYEEVYHVGLLQVIYNTHP